MSIWYVERVAREGKKINLNTSFFKPVCTAHCLSLFPAAIGIREAHCTVGP